MCGVPILPRRLRSYSAPQGEAAAKPPRTRRDGSPCRITSKTRAEPLTEGVKALRYGTRPDAADPCGSWNRSTPSAARRRHLSLKGEESERCKGFAAIRIRENADSGYVGEATTRARAKTASSISSVRRPVKVFCWLGWKLAMTTGPLGTATSRPWAKRGRGRGTS